MSREMLLDKRQATGLQSSAMKPQALTPEKVRAALIAGDGSPTRAAEMLGVSRQTIHDWMKRYQIRVERRVVLE